MLSATVRNTERAHEVAIGTGGVLRPVAIGPKAEGRGSSASGGELLVLALATCYCNDVFREASPRGIAVTEVRVEAYADFDAAGQPASLIEYRAEVLANASQEAIDELVRHVDSVAEVHVTVRRGMAVTLVS